MKSCNQCGKCCINYSNGGLAATSEEIEFWEVFHPEIARYVSEGNIWADPTTGRIFERCPWLAQEPGSKKYICEIYDHRPADCRHYPVTIDQMVEDECEMLEPRDLQYPKRAQRELDRIMIDSRPPVSS